MSRKILGVDIGRGAVSAVLVRGGIKGNWIDDHRRVPLSTDVPREEALSRALEAVVADMDVEGATCVAAFPAGEASFRSISAPFTERKKLRQILPYELESKLPFTPEDIVVDFNVPTLAPNAGENHVFAAAAPKERIEFYLDLLKSHGMEPEVLTIGGYALARALVKFSDETGGRILLAVEPDRATLFMLWGGEIILVRSLSVPAVSEDGLQRLCAQVQQTLAGFESRCGRSLNIREALVTGSVLEDSQVEAIVAAGLGLPVRTLDLVALSKMVSIETEGRLWRYATMDCSLALALSDVMGLDLLNFRRGQFALEKEWNAYKKDFIKTGSLALLVLMLLVASFVTDYFSMKNGAVRLDQEIRDIFSSTFPEVSRIVDPVQQMRVKLQEIKADDTFTVEMGRSVKTIDILNAVSRTIPTEIDVQLVSVIVGVDSVLISGDTGGFDAVDDVKNSLEKADLFQSVSITSTNKERTGNRVRFKIKAVI